jgi:hypothetical protein
MLKYIVIQFILLMMGCNLFPEGITRSEEQRKRYEQYLEGRNDSTSVFYSEYYMYVLDGTIYRFDKNLPISPANNNVIMFDFGHYRIGNRYFLHGDSLKYTFQFQAVDSSGFDRNYFTMDDNLGNTLEFTTNKVQDARVIYGTIPETQFRTIILNEVWDIVDIYGTTMPYRDFAMVHRKLVQLQRNLGNDTVSAYMNNLKLNGIRLITKE